MHDKSTQEEYAGAAIQVNPGIQIIHLSSTQGDNFSAWTDWLAGHVLREFYSPA